MLATVPQPVHQLDENDDVGGFLDPETPPRSRVGVSTYRLSFRGQVF